MRTENLRTVPLSSILYLSAHPIAGLFPMLPDAVRKEDGKSEGLTLPELADSILENGLQEPIVLFMEKILDGRNRRASCELVIEVQGIDADSFMVQVVDFVGTEEEAVDYVLALNIDRRHLTPGMRATTAVKYWEWATQRTNQGQRNDLVPNMERSGGRTIEQLAQRFRVSKNYIHVAKKETEGIASDRQQSEDATLEAERQRTIESHQRLELEAANAAADTVKAAIASEAANRASMAAIEATEKAATKANQAAAKSNRLGRVESGAASMGSLVKETRTDTSETDPVVKYRNKLNSACSNFKQAITELAEASGQGEDDYNYIGRKITELINLFDESFGVKCNEEG